MKRIKKINDGKRGGMLNGLKHSECVDGKCGIKAVVTDSGNKPVELETQEVIINRKSVHSNKTHSFDGKELTNKEILNEINTEDGNGVPILERGGHITKKINKKGSTTKKSKTMKKNSKTKTGKCPRGMKIQTIIFDKDYFNEETAKKWCQKHDYKKSGEDVTENSIRVRQLNPEKFDSDSFRTITLKRGVKAVVGCPIKETMKKGGGVGERKISDIKEDIRTIEDAISVTDNAADKKQLIAAKNDLEKEIEMLTKGETPKAKEEKVIDSEKFKELTEKIEKIQKRLEVGKSLMMPDEIEFNENKIKKLQKEISDLTPSSKELKVESKQKLSKDKDKPTKEEVKEVKEAVKEQEKPTETKKADKDTKKENEVKKTAKRVKKQAVKTEKKSTAKRIKKTYAKEITKSCPSVPLTRGRCQQTIAPYSRVTTNCKGTKKRVKKTK